MEDHRGQDRSGSGETGCSRRRFLVYSAAGPLALAGVRQAPPRRTGPGSARQDFVAQETPSRYFSHRGNGSEEMMWGPVGGYGDLIPNDRFYIHNRARPPHIDRSSWRLEITGDAVSRPRSFSYADLLALPQVTVRRTLDCGANCSAFFPELPPSGDGQWLPTGYTQWHFGAVGAAEWTGVRVRDVLAAAGLGHAVDVRFTGLDEIAIPEGTVHYSEVVAADKALRDDSLLVHHMNGADLPVDHGYPLRALMSGWGANTAVKWLGTIEASVRRLPAQALQRNQVLVGPAYPTPVRPTVGRVRSALELDEGVTLAPGDHTLHGRAWSGAGTITRVDVTIERMIAPGRWVAEMPWRRARLLAPPEPLIWVRFEVPWRAARPGRYRVMSRARDKAGNVQPRPADVPWNQHALGYDGHAPLYLTVLPPRTMP
ncbi:molybdopterin-dependent oxidoreductase [Microbispora rosea]|uniref:molybdopterin-dependent oxidoreductase n=1 Tax=Microbispora rosea TaxID=58117 RepID=UPI0036AD951D